MDAQSRAIPRHLVLRLNTHKVSPIFPAVKNACWYLVLDEVRGVVGVAIFQQEILVDGPFRDPCLQPAQPLQRRVAGGNGPHGHGIEEVDVLRR